MTKGYLLKEITTFKADFCFKARAVFFFAYNCKSHDYTIKYNILGHIKVKRQELCSFTRRTRAMEQQTSVFTPCVDVEEHDRGIEHESPPLHSLCPRTKVDTVAAPQVRQVYLITYSQANLERFPTRRALAECVINAFRQTGSGVMQWVCCIERHKHNGQHYHMAVKLERIRRWISAKQYLVEEHGISVNFSNTHDNYYKTLDERETEMMSVRWKVFHFNAQIEQSEQRDIPTCTKCFAQFILDDPES